MRRSLLVGLAVVALAYSSIEARAQWWRPGFGKRWWRDSSTSSAAPSPRSAASLTNTRPPTAPRESNLTFAPAPGAPQPSVSIPAATSPAGPVATSAPRRNWTSRLASAASATRNALTIKPREIPADDPVRLSTQPAAPQPAVFVSAARVCESQGRMNDARQQYEKALQADPQHADAMVGLGRLLHREGNLDAATQLYERALRAHPSNAVVLNDLGLCYARRGLLEQARQSLERAVAQEPRSKLYRNNLALVLVETNQPDAAFAELRAVHGDAAAHYNLGYMLQEKGHPAAAAHHLQMALSIEPQMEPARQLLARLDPGPVPQASAQLGPPQVGPPAQSQPRAPEWAQRRDLPASYRQAERPLDHVPPSEGQIQPPRAGAGPARISLSDDAGDATAPANRPAENEHRPTVGYVEPPMTAAQPPANYVFPPTPARLPERTSEPTPPVAPPPGDLPDYLRGTERAAEPQVQSPSHPPQLEPQPSRSSRWSQ